MWFVLSPPPDVLNVVVGNRNGTPTLFLYWLQWRNIGQPGFDEIRNIYDGASEPATDVTAHPTRRDLCNNPDVGRLGEFALTPNITLTSTIALTPILATVPALHNFLWA